MRRTILRSLALVVLLGQCAHAQLTTLLDNGPSNNRVDIVFLGDGYTQADLNAGKYDTHVDSYLSYMFDTGGVLSDPFVRYQNFFNAHAVEVVSNQSGADKPSQGIYVDTALDATYESNGIDRLLTINSSKANARRSFALRGTGITSDMQFVTVNDTKYGGAGGSWATFAGGNGSAREIALHEIAHSFSDLADEYVSYEGPFPGGEPSEVNVSKDGSGGKWSQWLGFDDPRGSHLDISAFEGARYYPTGVYRPSQDSKMRSLNRAFDAISREKIILDIYDFVDPVDDWLDNVLPIQDAPLWVDVVDPEVVGVQWFVDEVLVPGATGETFVAGDYGFGAGTYSVIARAYDTVLDHVEDGGLLDLVRRDLDDLQQEIPWTLVVNPPTIPGDFNGDTFVDAADLEFWENDFGALTGEDFLVWQRNYAPQPTGLHATVPEPGSVLLLCLGIVGCVQRRGTHHLSETVTPRTRRSTC